MLYRVQQMKAMKQHQAQAQYQEYEEYQQQNQAQSQQQAPAQPTYQQTVDQRNQTIAQAILDAHGQPASSPAQQQTQQAPQTQQQALPSASSTEVKDVVDLSEVWKKLDTRSTVWTLIIDDQAKVLTVSEYISRFQAQGARINAPPAHYVQMIDQIAVQNPQMLKMPFGDLLKILAIVDYDFDNGMDKDALARKVLGEAGFEENKKRFTQQTSASH